MRPGDGVAVDNHLHIGVMGYADDIALVSLSTDKMSDRVTSVARGGSRDDANMNINIKKTKTLHVAERAVAAVSMVVEEMKKTEAEYKHKCIFCPRRCKTARVLKIHMMAACNFQHSLTDTEFEINDIN